MENNSRLVNSVNNIIYGMINKIIMLILTFISRTVFVHALSTEYLGINGLFTDVLTLLSLADLGLGTAMAYSFYKPLAEKDEKQLAALTHFYKRIYSFIAISVASVGIILLPFIKHIVNTDKYIPLLEVYYLVFLANTVISYLFVYKSTIIAADQKSHLISKYTLCVNFTKVIIQILILYLTSNYLAYIIINVLATLTNNLLLSHKADTLYPYTKQKAILDQHSKKNIFSNIKSLFLYKFSSVILNGTDNILISTMIGTLSVGLYSNYYIITYNLMTISNLFFNSITASVGNIIVKEDEIKNYGIFKLLQMISFWLSGVFSICLLLLAQDFIRIWLGTGYLITQWTLIAIVLNFYLELCFPPVWSFREATGLFQKTNYIMIITAFLNLIFSIILGNYFQMAGIFFATFLSKLFTIFWYEPNLLYTTYFKRNPMEYYKSHSINAILVICSVFLLYAIAQIIKTNDWLSLILKGILVFVSVNLIYILRYCKTPEFQQLLAKLKKLVKKVR